MQVIIMPRARNALEGIPVKFRDKILKRAEALGDNPWPVGFKKLQGGTDGVHRVKQGPYRIFYIVRGQELLVIDVTDRKEAYRRR